MVKSQVDGIIAESASICFNQPRGQGVVKYAYFSSDRSF